MKLCAKFFLNVRTSVFFLSVSFIFFGEAFFLRSLPLYAQENKAAVETKEPKQSTALPPKLPSRPQTVSPETLRMMEKIKIKTKELEKREEQIRVREAQLKTLEAKIKKDLQKIEAALKKSKELMNVSSDLRKENIDSLVKIYSAMKPDAAAPLVAALDEKIAIQILSRMKSKIAGQVMGRLDTKAAKKLSEKIVGKDVFDKNEK